MPKFLLALLIGSTAAHAGVENFSLEARGESICVVGAKPDVCYHALPLEGGVDVLAQLAKYESMIDEKGERRPGVEVTLADVPLIAAGFGVATASRRELLSKYSRLVVTRVGVDLAYAKQTPAELPYLAQVEWATKAEPNQHHVSYAAGRIVTPESTDHKAYSDLNPDEFNAVLSKLVHVERVSDTSFSEAEIQNTLAPAVLSNVYAGYLVTLVQAVSDALNEGLIEPLQENKPDQAPPR